jgi:hypothetical protein
LIKNLDFHKGVNYVWPVGCKRISSPSAMKQQTFGEPHNVTLRFMFSSDLHKIGTSIKLQLWVITCINSGIVPGLCLNTLFSRMEKQNNQVVGKCLESPETFVEIPQKLEV